MSRNHKMCVVNSGLLEEIGKLVGSQAEIMTRVGISWNTWGKICQGLPVRTSVGERLRTRVLDEVAAMPSLRRKYPSSSPNEIVDFQALASDFLRPVVKDSARRDDGMVK
jgi:hypothetical protein